MRPRVRCSVRPTGQSGEGLSLAQARTALYGWLYARHEGGTLVLRVEPVSAPRDTPDAGRAPSEGPSPAEELRWLGLDWEDGLGTPCVGDALAAGPVDLERCQRLAGRAIKEGHLLVADGRPHPLLARVMGDHEAGISHLFGHPRASSQAEQERALHQALGWNPPRYVRLPAIAWPEAASPEGGGMPDRPTIAAYRARGYLSLALANHLARLGWTPRGKRELLSLDDLAARFDLGRVRRSAAPFDLRQLNWFNRRALRALDVREVTALLAPRWQAAYGAADRAAGTALPPVEWQQALALALREELDHLDQVAERARFAFADEGTPSAEARALLGQPYAAEVLGAFLCELPAVEPFTYEPIDAWISDLRRRLKAALGSTQGVRSRDVMYVLRAALTGRLDGPCLVEVCQLLGPARCARRVLAQLGVQSE